MGTGKQAQAAAVRSWMRINRPVLQTGHRRDNSSSVVESRLTVVSVLVSVISWGAGNGNKERHSASFSFRLRSHETFAQGFRQCFRSTTRSSHEDHRAFKLPRWWRLLREYGLGLHAKRVPDLAPFLTTPPEIATGLRYSAAKNS